jgi:hypothetical protein
MLSQTLNEMLRNGIKLYDDRTPFLRLKKGGDLYRFLIKNFIIKSKKIGGNNDAVTNNK